MMDENLNSLATSLLATCDQKAAEPAIIFRDGAYSFQQVKAQIAAFALHFEANGLGAGSLLQIDSSDPCICIPATVAARCLGAAVVVSEAGYDLDRGSEASHVFSKAAEPYEGNVRLIPMTEEALNPASYPSAALDEIVSGNLDASARTAWFTLLPDVSSPSPTNPITLSDHELFSASKAQRTHLPSAAGCLAVVNTTMMSYSSILRMLGALAAGWALATPGPWDFWRRAGVSVVSIDMPNVPNLLRAADPERRLPLVELVGDCASNGAISELSDRFVEVHCQFETASAGVIWRASLPSGSPISAPFGRKVNSSTEIRIDRPEGLKDAEMGILSCFNSDENILSDYLIGAMVAPATGGIRMQGRIWGEELVRDGRCIDPSWIDAVLRTVDGIVDVITFRTPKPDVDEIIAFTIFAEDVERMAVVERATALCRERLGASFVPAKFRPIRNIPRLQNGMPDRLTCEKLILDAIG